MGIYVGYGVKKQRAFLPLIEMAPSTIMYEPKDHPELIKDDDQDMVDDAEAGRCCLRSQLRSFLDSCAASQGCGRLAVSKHWSHLAHLAGQLVGTSSEICFETLSSSLWFRCVPRFFSQLLPFRYSVRSCLRLASRADACAGGCAVGCARERSSHCETSAASCCRTAYESVNLS